MLSLPDITVAGVTIPGQALTGLALLGLALFYIRSLCLPKPVPGIPHNKAAARRILGDIPEFQASTDRRQWIADQAIKHNSIFQVFMKPLGNPWVVVPDFREAKDICVRRTREFDRSTVSFDQFGTVLPGFRLALSTHDPRYKMNKDLMSNLMSPTFLHEVSAPHIHEKVNKLAAIWETKSVLAEGRPFSAGRDIHNAALDIIMGAAFGLDEQDTMMKHVADRLAQSNPLISTTSGTDNGKDELVEFVQVPLLEELDAFTVYSDGVGMSMKSPAPRIQMPIYMNIAPRMRNALRIGDNLVKRETDKSVDRLRNSKAERCAMDQMLAREAQLAEKEGREPNFYAQHIKAELIGYLVGGHDTTSSVLQWGTKYLTKHQPVQSRLRADLRAAYPSARDERRSPSVAEIIKNQTHVPYLDAFIEESLRHARPLPLTLRQATEDTQILDKFIPKGTHICFLSSGPGFFAPAMPVDDELRSKASRAAGDRIGAFDESDIREFIPERWLLKTTTDEGEEVEVFDPSAGPAMAFGLGGRGCFGRKLAYLELKIFFTILLWNLEFQPIPEALSGYEDSIGLTRIPRNVYVRLQKAVY